MPETVGEYVLKRSWRAGRYRDWATQTAKWVESAKAFEWDDAKVSARVTEWATAEFGGGKKTNSIALWFFLQFVLPVIIRLALEWWKQRHTIA